jgi:transposase
LVCDRSCVYGPYTKVFNRWNRWSGRAVWRRLFEALCAVSPDDDFHVIDSTTAKAHSLGRGKPPTVVTAAIARELSGFVWANAKLARPVNV